jgi:large subunit ribosomal protein L29
MKMEDIKKLDVKMIDAKVGELRKELFEMRMQKASAGIEKPHRKKEIKRDIARLLTAKNVKDA